MSEMLNTSNKSLILNDVDAISKDLFSSLKRNKFQITAANLNAFSKVSNLDPCIASFAKSIIKGASEYAKKNYDPNANDNFIADYENFLVRAMNDVHKLSKLNQDAPECVQLFAEMREKLDQDYQSVLAGFASKNDFSERDFSDQFLKDADRSHLIFNGKLYSNSIQEAEEKKNLLKTLFPNKNARIFVSEVLSQTTFNFADRLIMQERDPETNKVEAFNSPIPVGYPGNSCDLMNFDEDYVANQNTAAFYFIQSKPPICGFEMKLIHDATNKDKIVGIKVIGISRCSALNSSVFLQESVGYIYHKKEVVIDLSDMDKPKVSSFKTDYSGEQFGYNFPAQDENNVI